jgi:hypothetical protein
MMMMMIIHSSESTSVKVQYNRFNTGNSVISTMNSNYRIAATLCCIGTCFVLRNVSINTLHKGDDNDENDDNDDDSNNNNNNNNNSFIVTDFNCKH